MPLKFKPEIEGLEHCFVEISEKWTRAEIRELTSKDDEDTILKYLGAKLQGCHLERGIEGADPITSPEELLSEEGLDQLDLRLLDFVGTVLMQAPAILRSLGPLSGRLLSPGSAESRPDPKKTVKGRQASRQHPPKP